MNTTRSSHSSRLASTRSPPAARGLVLRRDTVHVVRVRSGLRAGFVRSPPQLDPADIIDDGPGHITLVP